MSEELGYRHAAAGRPLEPGASGGASSGTGGGGSRPPALTPPTGFKTPAVTSPGLAPPERRGAADESSATSSANKRSVPGGGSALASGDKPGDPYAHLLVLAADGLLPAPPGSATAAKLPPALDAAIDTMMRLVEAAPRCVVVVTGGAATAALMSAIVLRMPGGLSSFGPGKHVDALLKERAAPWGSVWDSALLVKALAKRQAATVRFGSVVVLTARALAAPTLRVWRHVFSDWRVLVDGGQANGGRDEPLHVRVQQAGDDDDPPADDAESDADAALRARSAALDDVWFAKGLETYTVHPWWPRGSPRDDAATPYPPAAEEAASAKRARAS